MRGLAGVSTAGWVGCLQMLNGKKGRQKPLQLAGPSAHRHHMASSVAALEGQAGAPEPGAGREGRHPLQF